MPHLADLTIDSSQVTADLTGYVVQADFADLPSEVHDVLAADAGDLRIFQNDGTTGLPREVASYDAVTDTGEFFFKITGVLSSTVNTTVQIWAGDGNTEPPFTDPLGRNAVWTGYATVNHFAVDGLDSTGNGNTIVASPSGTVVFNPGYVSVSNGGWLDTAANFAGPDFTDGYHIKFVWDNPATQTFAARQLSASQGGTSGIQLSENMLIRHNTNNQTVSTAGLYGGGIKPVDVTWNNASNALATYISGAPEGSGSSLQTPNAGGATSVPLSLYSHGDSFRALEGDLYEFRWSNDSHDADWIATEQNNRNTATFYSVTPVGGVQIGAIVPDTIAGVQIDEVLMRTAGDSLVRMVGNAQIGTSTQLYVEVNENTATLTWNGVTYSGPATAIGTYLAGRVGQDDPLIFVHG